MTREPLLMGIDVGSTAVKCVVMTPAGRIHAAASSHYSIDSPHPGWVEQHSDQWWRAVISSVNECVSRLEGEGVDAVSFSGHMSALVLLDSRGEPIRPGILVADTRSAEQSRFLKERYLGEFAAISGNEPLEAFVAPRLLWLREHEPEALARAVSMVFPKDYIRYKMTGTIATEPTDAGNTLLYDFRRKEWHAGMIRELGLEPSLFPPLLRTAGIAGVISKEAAALTGLAEGTPVVAGGADMACSQLGTGALEEGTMALTLSTSGQIVMPLKEPLPALAGRVTFHPSAAEGTMYAMGTVFTGGLGVDWGYRLLTGKTSMSPEDYERLNEWSEGMSDAAPGSGGLLFVPFLVGSGTPHFDAADRASWLGLSVGQKKEQLLHSIMEGVGYNIRENIELFASGGMPVRRLIVGGGGSKNDVWCRMIGDIAGKDVSMLESRDASALGAAMLAGIGAGCYPSVEAAITETVRYREEIVFNRERNNRYDVLYRKYLGIYKALNDYYHG